MPLLEGALSVQDNNADTPLHLCATFLVNDFPNPEFFRACILGVIRHLDEDKSGVVSHLFLNALCLFTFFYENQQLYCIIGSPLSSSSTIDTVTYFMTYDFTDL